MSRRILLLAYAAAEAQSLADALNALADGGMASRRPALEAQFISTDMSWKWAQAEGVDMQDPVDRIVAIRQYLTENVEALEAMRADLVL